MSKKNIKIYAFYNNKGGVGKTTLCFNAASLYAQKNPNTQVLVIDMCPQANISQFLLGGGQQGYKTTQKLQSLAGRKNVVGFIDWLLKGNSNFKTPNTSYKINVSSYNKHIPTNVYLIAGDSFLESLSLALNYAVINPANTQAWKEYMTAIRRLCEYEYEYEKLENLVVFIDCNPSFSIYTQMALTSSDYLIIPMMADHSSEEGIKSILMLLYDQYPSVAIKKYAENVITYNKQIKNFELKLPLIFEFVFNNYTSNQGIANAFQSIKSELMEFCYKQFNKFPNLFYPASNVKDESDWEQYFVSDVKDFHTAGKVSAALGIPICNLPNSTKYTMPNNNEVVIPKGNYTQAVDDVKAFVNKIL
ncbi:ATPase domain protein [Desulforamulus reducens MI-1]|uniref:ATPase domain protein n=1 Tax=Desulforamulus reducens (strain ATCC BAA-1160 / DSM 100696 / MI-1) TaxID=349161 RepID=A4J373_DESRM|nr:ParA family protein [Desulforamulus reducens]ABO49526.1 ATPase domain protein [Desulforamulus reducens MI-1]